jgi:protein-S-isoprenylcysteine O-methyltransferase Ste14
MSPKTLSILAFVVLVLALAYLFTIDQLFGRGPVTIALQIAAVLLMIWARITFGRRSFHAAANPTAGGLVTWGPYRYVRHPIYASIWLFFWAGIADHLSWLTAGIGLIIAGALVIRMLSEEKLILQQYPEYAEYARRTKRVLPGVF